ncbi:MULTISPECIES: flagellar assembly peptidoglycan hydrolase FlgJ [unclassified Salinivibrio]|uniref:flagellar assembly peptidoglycan hydrolase FlgJ n=1 Tax=unclassified Salinivibrio TaxID=2636825 RepID=UPI0006147279|nr:MULTISPECIES: flagellar assembly peptidoglycan hydrolase FlgJ [unclassified Salinivibrio]KKA44454.1 flagellar rod assembly protein FlgJ [Salinivibrio sp. KP-1]OOE74970.1 flagellar rod assembly protein/muramidase FlgJ [Salinivibrio sp. ML290]
MKSPVDSQFVHDISQLDSLRRQAVKGEEGDEQAALRSAAEQFESLFTQMLFKSMRDANEAFESDLIDDRTSKFYEQMADEQMASELSREGSLGLADMIVEQLGKAQGDSQPDMNEAARASAQSLPLDQNRSREAAEKAIAALDSQSIAPPVASTPAPQRSEGFDSPDSFVNTLAPHARRAARALGTDPAIILAQAALETGWGKKVIANARDNSHNLFNIKADQRWGGDKVATQTLEVYDGIPVKETASFRSYPSYQESFDDFVSFLRDNPRYEQALSQSAQPEQFIRALHQAGYATDPEYADKVIRVLDQVRGMMD